VTVIEASPYAAVNVGARERKPASFAQGDHLINGERTRRASRAICANMSGKRGMAYQLCSWSPSGLANVLSTTAADAKERRTAIRLHPPKE